MIRPYAQGERWTLYAGEALAVLPEVGPVDAVVTDPPYSSGGMVRGDRAGQSARAKYANSDSKLADTLVGFSGDNRDQRAYLHWCALWLDLARQQCPEGAPVVCFTDWRQLPTTTDAIQSGGWVWRGLVPWVKPPGCVRPQMGRFASSSEYAVWGTNGPSLDLVEVGCLPGHFADAPPRGDDKVHLTQKPIELMRGVVRICRPEGVVLDPFTGSGSTGVGALLQGYRFVGIEREPAHLATAARRLAEAEAGIVGRKTAAGLQAGLFG